MNYAAVGIALSVLILLPGCVSLPGPKSSSFKVPFGSSNNVVFTVIDIRPYVLQGDKNENFKFIGRVYGIPISVSNRGKQTFSDYLGKRLEFGFQSSGFENLRYLSSAMGTEPAAAFDRIIQKNTDVVIALAIYDARGDFPGWPGTPRIWFDYQLIVYNDSKEILASQRVRQDREPKMTISDNNFDFIMEYYYRAIEDLISTPEFISALTNQLL